MSGAGERDADSVPHAKGEKPMKWWKVVLGLTAVSAAALVLAGRTGSMRFRRSHKM